ncbi:hypothetical protein TNCV_3787271 [Trichonephila clavipes]|nr:hypothetical protein TNCV_3787271 [Trichonephila clavipes]
MQNDGEIMTSVQAESDPVDDETDEDNNNDESSMSIKFWHVELWSGTNNNQSAVLLNNCCSRESETLLGKNVTPATKNSVTFRIILLKNRPLIVDKITPYAVHPIGLMRHLRTENSECNSRCPRSPNPGRSPLKNTKGNG